MLLLKRMRRRAVVFAALLAVSALVSGISLGILGYLGAAEVSGVRAELSEGSGADVALELGLPTEADASAQNERVRALIDRVFVNGDRMLDPQVTRSVVTTGPAPLSIGPKAYAASIPDLDSHADLVAGAWPTAPGEASVQADAAEILGLAPGDTLDIGDVSVTVTGTWRLVDPLDPRWVSEAMLLKGESNTVPGPLVLSEDDLRATGEDTRTRWAIVPVVSELQAGDLDAIIRAWRALPDTMRADGGFEVNLLQLDGRFASTATRTQATVSALGAVVPVALLIIAAIVLLALAELGRLLATVRSDEYLLLWSRGGTVVRLAASAGLEGAAVAAVGAAVGTATSLLVLGEDPALLGAGVWIIPAAATITAAVVVAATTFAAVRSLARREAAEDAGRAARIGGAAAPVLLTIAATISTWQLLLYGSPLTPARDGGTRVDPIAVVAPALALLALVTLVLAALPLLARPLDGRSRTATGLALVPRALSRRIRLLAAPFVLCALAVGQLTVAAGFAQTWDAAYTTTSSLRAGAEISATGARADLDQAAVAALGGAEGVTEVAPLYSEQGTVGQTPAIIIAATPRAVADLATSAGGAFDPKATAGLIATALNGPVLPEGTREVDVGVEANSDVPVGLSIVVQDELGVQLDVPTTGTYRAELPPGHGGWRVLAFVVDLPSGGPTALTVTALTADGAPVDLETSWAANGFDPRIRNVEPSPTGAGFRSARGLTTVRIAPTLGVLTDDIAPPVVVSSALAELAGIRVGDTVPIALDARLEPFRCVVAGVVPAIPGSRSESAVLVDASVVAAIRARLYLVPPTPQVAWLGTSSAGAYDAARAAAPGGVIVRSLAADPDRGILGAAATALWIGAAGAGILAVIALIAVVGAQVRSRRGEIAVLRALGVSDRTLARGRQAELAIVLLFGLVTGAAAGGVVTALTIPALARAAVPGAFVALDTAVGVQPLGFALGIAALIIAFAVVLAADGRRVVR